MLLNANHVVHARFPNFNVTPGGWTESELLVFRRGSPPVPGDAVATLTVSKGQWILVPGTPDCYQLATAGAFLFSVPANVEFDLFARTKSGAVMGPWSNAVPFVRAGLLDAPMDLGITP